MADKILSIKLQIDTKDGQKLVSLLAEQEKSLTSFTSKVGILSQIQAAQNKAQTAYNLQALESTRVLSSLNEKSKAGFISTGIQIKLAEDEVKRLNKVLDETNKKFAELISKKALATGSVLAGRDIAPPSTTATNQGYVRNSFGTLTQNYAEYQKVLNQKLTAEHEFFQNLQLQNLRRSYNERLAVIKAGEDEAAEYRRQKAIQSAREEDVAYKNRLAAYEKLFAEIAAKERQLANIRSLGIANTQSTQANNRGYNPTNTQTVAQSNLAVFKEETSQYLAELNRRLALEQAIRTNGLNSRRTLELKAAQEEERIRKNLADRLQEIERSIAKGTPIRDVSTGKITSADIARTRALAQAERELTENNRTLASSVDLADRRYHNLFLRIAEIIGIYRILNGVINTITNSIRAIPQIGINLESAKASLEATAGSAGLAGQLIANLGREANRTGIEIQSLRENFRNFQASTSLAGEALGDTWRMFTNINTVVTGLHLSTDQATRTFQAFAQIFNKTKVQAEELVKQLGNLLPGAFASFQKANQDIFPKSTDLITAMRNGVVSAHDTMLKFTEYLAQRFAPAFLAASDGMYVNINRMKNSFTALGEAIYSDANPALIQVTKTITSLVTWMAELVRNTNVLKNTFSSLGVIIAALAGYGIVSLIGGLGKLSLALSATPAGWAAIIAALTAYLALKRREINLEQEAITSVNEYIKKRKEQIALEQKGLKETVKSPDASLKFDPEKDPAIIAARATLKEQMSLREQYVIELNKLQSAASRSTFVRPEDSKNIQNYKDQIKNLDGNIKFLTEDFKILTKRAEEAFNLGKVSEDSGILKEKYSAAVEKVNIGLLRAKGLTEEAAKAQEKLNYAQEKATIETQIRYWESYLKTLNIVKDGLEIIRVQTDIAGANQQLKAIDTIINAAGNKVSTAIRDQRNIISTQLDLLKTEYDNFVTDLDAEIARRKFNFENPLLAPSGQQETVNSITQIQLNALEQRKQKLLELYNAEVGAIKQVNLERFKGLNEYEKLFKIVQGVESSNNPSAKSSKGALGLMQIMPATFEELRPGIKAATASMQELRDAGREYLVNQLETFKRVDLALAAYNAGPGRVKQIISNVGETVSSITDETFRKVFAQLPKETQNYLQKILPQLTATEISKVVSTENLTQVKSKIPQSEEEKRIAESLLTVQKQINDLKKEEVDIKNESKKLTYEERNFAKEFYIQVLESQGRVKEATIEQLALENEIKYAKIAQIDDPKIKQAASDQLKYLTNYQINNAEIQEQAERRALAETRYNDALQRVQTQIQAGYVDSRQAIAELQPLQQQYLDTLIREYEIVAEKALIEKDSIKRQQELLDLQIKINQLKQTPTIDKLNQQGIPSWFLDFNADKLNTGIEQTNSIAAENASYAASRMEEIKAGNYANLLTLHEQHNANLQEIDQKYAQSTVNTYAKLGGSIFGELGTIAQDYYSLMAQIHGANSKEAIKAFNMMKVARIGETIMNTAAGIMNVWATAGNPYVAAALTALVAAQGAIQVATIASQAPPAAHGGLGYVPKEQTYLLDKGERVLSPNQNKDFTSFIAKNNGGNSGTSSSNQNIRIINTIDSASMDNYLGSDSAERIIRNIIRTEVA